MYEVGIIHEVAPCCSPTPSNAKASKLVGLTDIPTSSIPAFKQRSNYSTDSGCSSPVLRCPCRQSLAYWLLEPVPDHD